MKRCARLSVCENRDGFRVWHHWKSGIIRPRPCISATRRADALFVAVGKPGLVTGEMVKPGAAVIDIGINQIEVTDEDGNSRTKTVGDVDFESVHEVAGWISPVHGGVGPATLSILMRNVISATVVQKSAYEQIMAGS